MSSPSTLLLALDPIRNTGLHPTQDGRAAMVRMVCSWQNGVISTGIGNPGPSPLHSFDSSTDVDIFFFPWGLKNHKNKCKISFSLASKSVWCDTFTALLTNDNKFVSSELYHLLSQQSTATALDKIEVWVNIIRPINCHIQFGMLIQRNERNS